ncbi:unnamed protein product [Phyllotreta striolata]|uniref:Anaphase-promoting complex subunit 7 n=1 Tax=Phyllotreta striolata TaxID=444603 RepID=A0A9N9TN88_PHYSR|nr:unnamed protein product [Phyllotreta striolata]
MNTILKQLQLLKDAELHSNICKVCDKALTLVDQKSEANNAVFKLQVTLYYAEALFLTHQHSRAENLYREALQLRKDQLLKTKNSSNKMDNNLLSNMPSDVDLKYQIYLCCAALKQKQAAGEILQSIAPRHRTPKINMALGNIYKELGMDRAAVASYKEVLRECPMALEAAENLLKLGIKSIEVNSLMLQVTTDIGWLNQWIKAQGQLQLKDYAGALNTYKSMEVNGLLKNNHSLLLSIAYCYLYMCEYDKAISVLQKILRLDPHLLAGRDLLSTLLAASGSKEHIRALELLTPKIDIGLWSAEHWVVLGNYVYSLKKYDKATYYGHQALIMDRKNVEALLLKANALLQIKKYQESITHCSEALQICNMRYDIYKCLVECYIQTNRLREAESMAINACNQLNFSAQGYCLHAFVLLKDPMASSKTIRRTLEKAVSLDKSDSTNALYMLVEFLQREQQHEQASQLLLKRLQAREPTSRLHQLLGDCFINLKMDDEAFDHYNVALNLDPTNQRATEGLNNIGRSLTMSKRDSYYTCVGGETSYCNSQGTNSLDLDGEAESDTESGTW